MGTLFSIFIFLIIFWVIAPELVLLVFLIPFYMLYEIIDLILDKLTKRKL